jgi:hypothetical protein
MPSYLIYIPGARGADPAQLDKVGLEIPDMHDGASSVDVTAGPDGGRGVLFHWPNAAEPECNPLPGYFPDLQEWTPAKPRGGQLAAGRFWLGREKDKPVEPESLLRKKILKGTPLTLLDGQEWLIPAAPLMPQTVGEDENGLPVLRTDNRYQPYWEQVVAYYEYFLYLKDRFEAGVAEDLHIRQAWPFSIQTLQWNYRVDRAIVDWLGLLNQENIVSLILRTFEGDQIRLAEALKKKTSATT